MDQEAGGTEDLEESQVMPQKGRGHQPLPWAWLSSPTQSHLQATKEHMPGCFWSPAFAKNSVGSAWHLLTVLSPAHMNRTMHLGLRAQHRVPHQSLG